MMTAIVGLTRFGLIAVAAASLFAGPALAGSTIESPVVVDLGARYAEGSVGSARNGSGLQYIGCSTTGTEAYHVIICYALDAEGDAVSCSLNSQTATGNLGGLSIMSESALLSFSWDASYKCTSIFSTVSSETEPKEL